MLFIWYTLSRVNRSQKIDEIDALFYEIFVMIKNQKEFFYFLDSFKVMFKNQPIQNYFSGLLQHLGSKKPDMVFIHKFIHCAVFLKGITRDLHEVPS